MSYARTKKLSHLCPSQHNFHISPLVCVQGASSSSEIERLQNHIAELEAEKGHLQLKLVDLEEQLAQQGNCEAQVGLASVCNGTEIFHETN